MRVVRGRGRSSEDRVAAEQAARRSARPTPSRRRCATPTRCQAQAADAAAGARTAAVRADARAALAAAAEHARATLATSAGRGRPTTRSGRRSRPSSPTADAAAARPAPPPPRPSGRAQRHRPARARPPSLAAADAAVAAAHDAWLQEQAAAAAAAAAARRPAARGPKPASPGAPAAPSCGTTYSGPPFYTSPATAGGDGSNGRLPPEALTAISWDVDPRGTPYYLTNAAAAALERLNAAFRAQFGHSLDLDLTYRDYDTQVAMRDGARLGRGRRRARRRTGPGWRSTCPSCPCEYGWDTPQRDWLVSNGPAYGWVSPSWAGRNGSNPEYWHFEFRG